MSIQWVQREHSEKAVRIQENTRENKYDEQKVNREHSENSEKTARIE